MSPLHEHLLDELRECLNCGNTVGLMRCSRCRNATFCGASCQKAYWPLHKAVCRRNEFAEAVEQDEPVFAAWMRQHGKLAVLKDDEVDRLERASKAICGPDRQEVMSAMYNRLDPKPLAPVYTLEERQQMQKHAVETYEKHVHLDPSLAAYQDLANQADVKDCGHYLWQQDGDSVHIWLQLRKGTSSKHIMVGYENGFLKVAVDLRNGVHHFLLRGPLWGPVTPGGTLWCKDEHDILEIILMKQHSPLAALPSQAGQGEAREHEGGKWPSLFAHTQPLAS